MKEEEGLHQQHGSKKFPYIIIIAQHTYIKVRPPSLFTALMKYSTMTGLQGLAFLLGFLGGYKPVTSQVINTSLASRKYTLI